MMKSRVKKQFLGVFVGVSILISIGFQSNFFEVAKQIDIYTTLFKELNMYYIDEINPAELTEKSINHMLSSLDPYTRYYDEQGVEKARINSTGEYGGIGAVSHYKNKVLTIREILKNSPAEKSGIRPGDKILKIDDVLVSDYEDSGVSSLLNGLPDTKVFVDVERQNKKLTIEIIRKKIELSPVPHYAMLTEEVGYISFVKFNGKASSEVKKAFLELKDDGMKKLIIDVRSNPGGLLGEAVNISNFFVPKDKIIVTTKAKIEKWSDTFKTRNEPLDLEIPVVVLINNRSASASEILAGSLQDYDRAVVIGERSFGKGLVQRYRELTYGTQMKLTISKYYTPSGRCIQELDYTNRKGNDIPKFSDSGRKAYKTANGRTVFGGGGIMPDIEIKKPKTTKTTQALFRSNAFFNYATNYYYKNKSIASPEEFNLNTSEFNALTNYLKQHNSEFETSEELEFKKALDKANENGVGEGVTSSYNTLLNSIQQEKLKELAKNKEEITTKLTEEIVKRYYYSEGVYKQKAKFDKTILKAVEVLTNGKEYSKALKN
ncbi:carboxyl-terminal processing protease [Lutibacter oricola]|uniref:Carboxyl-terminal processing protease n=1 Tax=Lutibacter oricola TaxID=762486 RepID=A0A1H3DDP3_9FLAO|nr:S41 family peptidase [Lutibacter oricola]SDX64573.1 carboxyl-terminal processing protease [Lutibacter oricola]